jgi:hypothetical protein
MVLREQLDPFYRLTLPIIVRVVLVVLPAASAMRAGLRLTPLSVRQAFVSVVIVGTLTLLTARRFAVAVIFGWWSLSAPGPVIGGLWVWRGTWQLRLCSLVMSWPAAYLMARAVLQRWSMSPSSSVPGPLRSVISVPRPSLVPWQPVRS